MRKAKQAVVSRLASTLVLLLPLLSCGGSGPPPVPQDKETERSIEFVDLASLDAALAKHQGEGMLLNFWAIWCAPCVAELPELLEVGEHWHERGGRVVGISYDLMVAGADTDEVLARMEQFLEKRGHHFPVLIYDDADYSGINERYDLAGPIPVTLAIDKTGRVVDRQDGSAGRERFEEMMRKALGEQ